MIQPTHSSRRILLPARGWFIYLSLCAALLLNLIPLGRLPGIPDWVALTLAFWCIHQPLKVGMGAAFFFGLAMDVANASVMGQHALAYVLLAFAAGGLSRRILWFPVVSQALHVLPLLLGTQLIMLMIRLVTGAEFPGVLYFLSSFVAVLLWHPLNYILLLPQYRAVEHDENRPI
ncbi:rod shape-determining protein MreD [Hydrogenophaga sp.]|jgi:rod shape-determining protein MreD|uniref:rod shape-determining protein MreD n=1 Tax=Hydrogenophaga sp. TaxID=1904254 RepID=UPI0027197E92|nr:rod shape-determining protein MreD [Hydrogenophaga sp.]MDO9504830.1 rod shape-determining protein MreD [Hydrogenophaga sp.]